MPANTAFDTIMVQSRDMLRDRLCEGVGRMLEGAETTLTELADKLTAEDQRKRCLDGRDLLLANREVIESQFRQRYSGEFQKVSNKATKIATSFSDFSLDELSLV